MIEDFSGGYYRASMNVQEYDDGPIIERELYRFIQHRLLGGAEDVIVRVGLDCSEHFRVGYENAVPRETLAVPNTIHEPSASVDVFILKEDRDVPVGEYYV